MKKIWENIKEKGKEVYDFGKHNLVKLGVIGGLTLAELFGINNQEVKAQEPNNAIEYIGNLSVKSRPNKINFNYYGSGDVNRDEGETNKINQNDVSRLEQVANGTYSNPNDRRLRDRADVNGDGVVNSADKTILQEYVNGTITLPSDLSNTTKTQTLDWIQKMINIDNPSKTCPDPKPDVCDCTQFSEQMYINFHGVDKESIEGFLKIYPYDTLDNGRFNINMVRWDMRFYDSFKEELGAHNMNGFFIGENALNFYDWKVAEPQENSIVEIGQGYLGWADSSQIDIRALPLIEGELPWYTPLGYYIGYIIKNKIPSEGVNYHEEYPTNSAAIPVITQVDNDNPNISLSKPTPGEITNDPRFVSTVTDATIFDRYKMVDGQKVYYNKNNSFSIDGVKSNEQMFNYTNRPLEGLSDGEHTLSVTSIDEFDNESTLTRTFIVDKKVPEFSSPSPTSDSTYNNKNVNFVYSAKDENLDLSKSYYNFNGVQNYLSNATDTIPLTSKEGMNKLEIYLIDKAGNHSTHQKEYEYSPETPVEDISQENEKSKAYPNPAKDYIRFEIGNNFGRESEVEMYDVSGRLIGSKKTKEDSFDYDLSNYARGFYIYRVKDETGKTIGSGKIVKE